MATSPRSVDTISLCSTVSSCPDRNGFYGGFQRTDKPKEPLSKAQIIAREKKWLYMIDNWSLYMSKNYKKVCAINSYLYINLIHICYISSRSLSFGLDKRSMS